MRWGADACCSEAIISFVVTGFSRSPTQADSLESEAAVANLETVLCSEYDLNVKTIGWHYRILLVLATLGLLSTIGPQRLLSIELASTDAVEEIEERAEADGFDELLAVDFASDPPSHGPSCFDCLSSRRFLAPRAVVLSCSPRGPPC